MASSNDAGGDVTGVFFSISGAALPATDEATQFAVLTYALNSELGDVTLVVWLELNGTKEEGSPARVSLPPHSSSWPSLPDH